MFTCISSAAQTHAIPDAQRPGAGMLTGSSVLSAEHDSEKWGLSILLHAEEKTQNVNILE